MKLKKTLILGLMATAAGGWLQAETLTFDFTTSPATSTVTFGGGMGNPFTGTLGIQTVAVSGGASESCTGGPPGCTLTFTTGNLGMYFADTTMSESAYGYQFAANNSTTAFTATTVPSGGVSGTGIGGSTTIGGGSMGTTNVGGFQFAPPPNLPLPFAFSTTVTGDPTGFATLLAALHLTSVGSGTLSFTIAVPYGSVAMNGGFTGTVSGGQLSLDVSAVPEPSSILLIGLGLICVAFAGRKRMLAQRL